MIEGLLPGVQHLQNIHPLVVHYPIAFLTGAALFYGLRMLLQKEGFATQTFHLLILGMVSAAIAVGTGLYAEPGVMILRTVRKHLLEVHETYMLSILGLSFVLTAWTAFAGPLPKKGRPIFILLFNALLAILTLGAGYGARMVYDYNAGENACSQPIELSE
jgi:uncharacterized membrane protein